MANTGDAYRREYDDMDDPYDGKWWCRKHKKRCCKTARRRLRQRDLRRFEES